MALSVLTNVASLNAQRNLVRSTNSLNKTFQRLSSGMRINRAADDAAGLSITNRMTAQVRGLNQAVRNANDGISLVQVAEGALDETTNALQRIRELAVQASNGTYTSTDRTSLNQEVQQLISEINRIASQTQFNNSNLLTGSFTAKRFQVGAYSGQIIMISIGSAAAAHLGVSGLSLGGSGMKAMSAISKVDLALNSISDIRSKMGAIQSRFESVISNLSNISENTSAARSRILDADIAAETSNLTSSAILQQAGTSILAQANQQPQMVLQLLG
ncbi:MAG: flagellin FliC [Magnetococcales bacterium]|nr:flagellin FliC [Magnetococcales bacterium]